MYVELVWQFFSNIYALLVFEGSYFFVRFFYFENVGSFAYRRNGRMKSYISQINGSSIILIMLQLGNGSLELMRVSGPPAKGLQI